jgi:hypothetical protein
LFVRVTLLEAPFPPGPLEGSLDIVVIHRAPWYPGYKYKFTNLFKAQPSAWVDVSKEIADGQDVVTGMLSFTADGKPITGPVRARVELARSADATQPLASIEISDPGGKLGFVMPERGVPDAELAKRLQSIAQISQRHIAATQGIAVAPADVPKEFITSTRSMRSGVYTDPVVAANEVNTVLRLGYNTLVDIDPKLAAQLKVPYIGGADYRPPGVDGPTASEQALLDHYSAVAKSVQQAHGSLDRLRLFAMSDEPSWNFPETSEALNKDAAALARFRAYLQAQALTPELLGKVSWDEVKLTSPPAADAPLAERRLWYHSVRFAGDEQIRQYAAAASALRQQLGPQVLAYTNWNNPGIMFSDVSQWHNAPFTASHNWFDFSRAHGSTCLWLGPGMSESGNWYRSTMRTWSMALDLLRSAADANGQGVGRFGAYVHHEMIPDERGYEVALSIMSVAGRGGSGYDSYLWGPHYAFTEYMWSEKFGHYKPAADANRLIARSEPLMIGAKPARARIALLWPITSQMYDLNKGGYWTYNRDCLVEMQHIWFALNHNNYPVDFVDETMVQQGALDKYEMLYMTGPNLGRKTAESIAAWVGKGGTLWASAAAGMRDEYNQPLDVIDAVIGIGNRSVNKLDTDYSPKGGLRQLQPSAQVKMGLNSGINVTAWPAYGSLATFQPQGGEVIGTFDNSAPAAILNRYQKGRVFYFAAMPGLSYSRGATEQSGQPTIDYPEDIADLVIDALPPVAKRKKPATTSLRFVEAAVLESKKGRAITLMNWSGKPVRELTLRINDVPRLKSVRSARLGKVDYKLAYTKGGTNLVVTLPMPEVVDVILVEMR